MPWNYSQSTGQLTHDGCVVWQGGYSGAFTLMADGRNNPMLEGIPFQGPIPRGQWRILPAYNDPGHLGATVMALLPVGHNALGRGFTSFRIHGNNSSNNASEGCIILPSNIRQQINNSGDHVLNVVP